MEVDLQLIGKYLSGEASPDEALAIDNWKDKSPQNNQMFQSAVRLWEASSKGDIYRQPQIKWEWKKLKKAITKERQPLVWRLNKSIKKWRIAAAVLLLLSTAVVFYILHSQTIPVTYSQVIGSEETTIRDTLKDETVISVFRGSRLSVQDQFAVTGREVKLDGMSYFSVKHLPGQPFIIHTGGIKITVLGTIFNVKNDSEKVTVSVRKGEVSMQKDTAGIVVTTGATGTFYKSNRHFELYPDSLNENSYSYATWELSFNNTSMSEIKDVLENTYDVKVLFKDKSLANLRINTRFENQPLDYVAKIIGASLGIQYELKNDTLYFY